MKKINFGKLIFSFFIILLIIIIFTAIDFLIHSLSRSFAVPSYYFRNKIIFGAIIGFIAYLFIKNKKLFEKSLIFSLIISVLLQLRYYFIEHYSLLFVLEFLVFHFVILLGVSYLLFKLAGE